MLRTLVLLSVLVALGFGQGDPPDDAVPGLALSMSTEYAIVEDLDMPAFSGDWAIEFWIRAQYTAPGAAEPLTLFQFSEGDGTPLFRAGYDQTGLRWVTGGSSLSMGDTTTWWSADVPDATWTHFGLSCEEKTCTHFINGTAKGSGRNLDLMPAEADVPAARCFVFGQQGDADGCTATVDESAFSAEGLLEIDLLRIWGESRVAGNFRDFRFTVLEPSLHPNLLHQWTFDDPGLEEGPILEASVFDNDVDSNDKMSASIDGGMSLVGGIAARIQEPPSFWESLGTFLNTPLGLALGAAVVGMCCAVSGWYVTKAGMDDATQGSKTKDSGKDGKDGKDAKDAKGGKEGKNGKSGGGGKYSGTSNLTGGGGRGGGGTGGPGGVSNVNLGVANPARATMISAISLAPPEIGVPSDFGDTSTAKKKRKKSGGHKGHRPKANSGAGKGRAGSGHAPMPDGPPVPRSGETMGEAAGRLVDQLELSEANAWVELLMEDELWDPALAVALKVESKAVDALLTKGSAARDQYLRALDNIAVIITKTGGEEDVSSVNLHKENMRKTVMANDFDVLAAAFSAGGEAELPVPGGPPPIPPKEGDDAAGEGQGNARKDLKSKVFSVSALPQMAKTGGLLFAKPAFLAAAKKNATGIAGTTSGNTPEGGEGGDGETPPVKPRRASGGAKGGRKASRAKKVRGGGGGGGGGGDNNNDDGDNDVVVGGGGSGRSTAKRKNSAAGKGASGRKNSSGGAPRTASPRRKGGRNSPRKRRGDSPTKKGAGGGGGRVKAEHMWDASAVRKSIKPGLPMMKKP